MSSPAPKQQKPQRQPTQPPPRQPLPARPMVRTLATLQRLSDLAPHPRIPTMCTGKAGGWSVVFPSALGLRDHERVIFFEDGSQLPARVAWMRDANLANNMSNFKVYAADMKGSPNEGHVIPVAALTIPLQLAVLERVREEAAASSAPASECDDGIDVTALLGVSKFCRTASEKLETIEDGSSSSSPVAAAAAAESSFARSATWVPPKTAEIRGKTNETKVFTAMRGLPYYITLKYNGSSITILPHKDSAADSPNPKLAVSSRNREVDPFSDAADDKRYIAAASLLAKNKLPLYDGVQAEMVGPGIAWNEHQLPECSIRVFNMYRDRQLLGLDEMREACAAAHHMMVDVLEEGEAFDYTNASQLTHLMNKRLPCGQKLIEGIVIRPKTPRLVGGSSQLRDYQLSFKLLNIREEEKQDPADRG